MKRLILRAMEAKVTVPTFLWAISSCLLSLVALVGLFDPTVSNSDFARKLLIDFLPWTILVLTGSFSALIGLSLRIRKMIMFGSFLAFCMWIFGTISFVATNGVATALVITVPYLFYYGYVYLASSFHAYDKEQSMNDGLNST